MHEYKVIGIDLAKTKFHLAAIDHTNKVVLKKNLDRDNFFTSFAPLLKNKQTFAFEACSGCHYTAQKLEALGHNVIVLKPKDVKPYAKSRQKNDINDAIAICKAAIDPDLMRIFPKSPQQQEIAYLHKARQNSIQQRIQRSNSLMNSLFEFGYMVAGGKARFAKECINHVEFAFEQGSITDAVYQAMLIDCQEIHHLQQREKDLDKILIAKNKLSIAATTLEKIPGIGPINASILSNKEMHQYESAKDFAASLGLVPRQHTTGGQISLGSITKQGDRYARTMLIQAARTVVMRVYRQDPPCDPIYQFAAQLLKRGKHFNVTCVAVANKLARIAYACLLKNTEYAVS